jgi:hypothetical protein
LIRLITPSNEVGSGCVCEDPAPAGFLHRARQLLRCRSVDEQIHRDLHARQ